MPRAQRSGCSRESCCAWRTGSEPCGRRTGYQRMQKPGRPGHFAGRRRRPGLPRCEQHTWQQCRQAAGGTEYESRTLAVDARGTASAPLDTAGLLFFSRRDLRRTRRVGFGGSRPASTSLVPRCSQGCGRTVHRSLDEAICGQRNNHKAIKHLRAWPGRSCGVWNCANHAWLYPTRRKVARMGGWLCSA